MQQHGSCPKNTIKKVGFFDELFYHYGEDVNYCQRLNYHDLKTVFVPNAKIYHDRETREINLKNDTNIFTRKLKIELANVNEPKSKILARFKYLKNSFLLSSLKDVIKFRSFKSNFKLYKFIVNNKKNILDSYEYNRKTDN